MSSGGGGGVRGADGLAGREWVVLEGHVLDVLAGLPEHSVHVCVTSPPYWGLRSYSTAPQIWGGSPDCDHMLQAQPGPAPMTGGTGAASAKQVTNAGSQFGNAWQNGTSPRLGRHASVLAEGEADGIGSGIIPSNRYVGSATCTRCGAWRGELGSEPVHDCLGWATGAPCGACFICHLRTVFAAVWRVLRDDGTCFVNLGDSYAGSGKGPTGHNGIGDQEARQGFSTSKGARLGSVHGESGHTSGVTPPPGLKAKDLCMLPARLALALQADGWYLRGDYIWAKPNPMPESVTDRCTRSHEYVFHLSKRPRYYWDADAIRDGYSGPMYAGRNNGAILNGDRADRGRTCGMNNPAGRNKRSVWTIPTEAFPEAHFATYPTALVEPCILAGTSAHGCCSACGAPYRRVSAKQPNNDGYRNGPGGNQSPEPVVTHMRMRGSGGNVGGTLSTVARYDVQTIGWAPTCAHTGADVVPCTVLDIFAGSGTTGVVARRLGRRFIGVELNEQYVRLAEKRIASDAPLFESPAVAEPPPPAPTLWDALDGAANSGVSDAAGNGQNGKPRQATGTLAGDVDG